ncbi:MAG: hypothetical protein KME54_28685 [Tolypothrix brevis GSE-NOS-MK-07-07A]|jgi:hypothetical protein|nr:hypothetical protein [Tolypothrix brevis GSE-NOS-MK-07-07A]
MQVVTQFKCTNLVHLNIVVPALYLLSEPSTSKQARSKALRLAKEGENITHTMERQRYIVRLSGEERQELEVIVKKGKGGAHNIRNAQILLHSDENGERLTVEAIAKLLQR